MPKPIKPDQNRFLVELTPDLARKLDAFRIASGENRVTIVRKAIGDYVSRSVKGRRSTEAFTVPRAAARDLKKFCSEGDHAAPDQVVANALAMYLPQRRWAIAAERHPETVSPAMSGELRPEVARRVERFCAKARIPSRWFVEEALQELVAARERDEWKRFLFRAAPSVVARLSEFVMKTGVSPEATAARAFDFYVASRVAEDPELGRRLEIMRRENAAQLALFHALDGAV